MDVDNDVSPDLAAIEALERDIGDIERELNDLEQAPASTTSTSVQQSPHGAHDPSQRNV